MGVNWQKGRAGGTRGENCKVHLVQPGSQEIIAFLCGADEVLQHKVHWIREESKSFPCLEPHCKLCPWPSQQRWYAPVLRYTLPLPHAGADFRCPDPPYKYTPLRWERVVLEITKGWSCIVDQVSVGALFHLERMRATKQSRTRFNHLGILEMDAPECLSFDVRPAVMRMWGLSEKLWE